MTSYGSYPEQPNYGQPPAYGQPSYGQPAYGYGGGPPVPRPGGVTAAAVLGFILGAFAVLGAVLFLVGSTYLVGADVGGTGYGAAFGGIIVGFALVLAAIAVILIWGSVLAVTGRSRVLLIVGAAIVTAVGLIGVLGVLGNSGTTNFGDAGAGSAVAPVIGLLMAILIVVLLSLGSAGHYFAAERSRRGR